jgi:hypothetical protein
MRGCCPVIKKPRNRFFPNGGDRNSQRAWNDPSDPLNIRRFHGTDPLNQGPEPGDTPCAPIRRDKKRLDIP